MPIITKTVGSNPTHDEVYSIQHYVIKFVSDLQHVREVVCQSLCKGFWVPNSSHLCHTIGWSYLSWQISHSYLQCLWSDIMGRQQSSPVEWRKSEVLQAKGGSLFSRHGRDIDYYLSVLTGCQICSLFWRVENCLEHASCRGSFNNGRSILNFLFPVNNTCQYN